MAKFRRALSLWRAHTVLLALALVTLAVTVLAAPVGARSAPPAGGQAALASAHWSSIPAGPLSTRSGESTVWTGTDLVIWGGASSTGTKNDGALFDPRTETWARMPRSPLSPREDASAVWTGHLVLFWGGRQTSGTQTGLDNGASYDPATRRWRMLPASPLSPRFSASAFWTGKVAILVGGQRVSETSSPLGGATYDPVAGTWARLPVLPTGGLGTPVGTTSVWSGRRLITWTTFQIITELPPDGASIRPRQEGAEWAPGQAGWHLLPALPPHVFTYGATSVWVDGHDVLIGGTFCLPAESCLASLSGSAEVFDPSTMQWTSSPTNPVLDGDNPMISTGSSAVVIDDSGTTPGGLALGDGIAYSPSSNTVRSLPPAPSAAVSDASLAWTGHELLLWGTDAASDGAVAMKLS